MFRKKVLTILAVVLFAGNGLYAVPDKIFTSSGQILLGEEWSNVYIYNDDTIVDMLGGLVDGIATYDASMVNVTGGTVYTLDALEFSTANISGGYVYGASAWDHAVVDFFDNASAVTIGAGDYGTLNMIGGTTNYIGSIDSGILNLYSGLVTDSLGAWDFSIVNIYGYDLVKTSTGGRYGYGRVYGFWLDDTLFTIDLNGSETFSHINLIPEPTSLILLAFGSLILKRRR
jgi:hypothetical protein